VTGRPRPNYRLAKPLFIREANASFGHTHLSALQQEEKMRKSWRKSCCNWGVTSRRVLGLCLGISWISSALLFPSEGVEEDLLPCF
jgi:hypothetical protein